MLRSLGLRLALASVGAVAGVLVLQQLVRAPVAAAARPVHAAPTPSPLAALGFRVTAVAGDVLLCSRERSVPPGASPVLLVADDGTIVARRPPAAAARDAAIVTPPGPFAAWSPAARATVLELLAALLPSRPLPAQRVRAVDGALRRGDLEALCRWVP